MRAEGNAKISTLRRKIASIRNFLHYLHRQQSKTIKVVPALDYRELKQEETKSQAPTISIEEWERLKERLKRARNPQVRPIACLAVMGGGRTVSECMNMRWEDVRTSTGNDLLRIRKSGRGDFYLELLPELKKILLDYKKEGVHSDQLFSVPKNNLYKTLNVHASKAGIEHGISFMTFRASFIKWAIKRGDSREEIMNATLHKSPQMLDKYYGYVQPSTISFSSILKMRR